MSKQQIDAVLDYLTNDLSPEQQATIGIFKPAESNRNWNVFKDIIHGDIIHGENGVAGLLAEASPEKVRALPQPIKDYLLCNSILEGNPSIVATLLERGADPAGVVRFGPLDKVQTTTPLHEAARLQDTTMLKALLAKGAVDVNVKDSKGNTVLVEASTENKRLLEALTPPQPVNTNWMLDKDSPLRAQIVEGAKGLNITGQPDAPSHQVGTTVIDGREVRLMVVHAVDPVITNGEQVVTLGRKFPPGQGKPCLPGGMLDATRGGVESAQQAAARETLEEVGIKVNAEDGIPVGERNMNRPFDVRVATADMPAQGINKGDIFMVSTQAVLFDVPDLTKLKLVPDAEEVAPGTLVLNNFSDLSKDKMGIADHYDMVAKAIALHKERHPKIEPVKSTVGHHTAALQAKGEQKYPIQEAAAAIDKVRGKPGMSDKSTLSILHSIAGKDAKEVSGSQIKQTLMQRGAVRTAGVEAERVIAALTPKQMEL